MKNLSKRYNGLWNGVWDRPTSLENAFVRDLTSPPRHAESHEDKGSSPLERMTWH